MVGTEFYKESRSSKTSFLTGMWVGFFLCYPYFMYKHFVGSPWDSGGGVIWQGRWGYDLAPTYFNILRRIREKCAISLKSVGVGGYLLGSDKNSVSGIFCFCFWLLIDTVSIKSQKQKKNYRRSIKFYFRENSESRELIHKSVIVHTICQRFLFTFLLLYEYYD